MVNSVHHVMVHVHVQWQLLLVYKLVYYTHVYPYSYTCTTHTQLCSVEGNGLTYMYTRSCSSHNKQLPVLTALYMYVEQCKVHLGYTLCTVYYGLWGL